MKKTKVVLLTMSAQRQDGSRETTNIYEICSCTDPSMARRIMQLLRKHVYTDQVNADAKADEPMYLVSTL